VYVPKKNYRFRSCAEARLSKLCMTSSLHEALNTHALDMLKTHVNNVSKGRQLYTFLLNQIPERSNVCPNKSSSQRLCGSHVISMIQYPFCDKNANKCKVDI
jgi:aromatic ring-cleaving dioxygenase